jgi:Ribose/xylose/arabinose/galactoside ABC-type transport systems, permease components
MAAGQTLVMLTGGVDLSVATTATAGAFAVSRFGTEGSPKAILIALAIGLAIGLVNGIGVALFRVNALIMTLGISTITLGLLTVQAQKQFTSLVPNFVVTLGSGRVLTYIPYDLFVWVPIARLIVLGLRYSGIGRMIYAVGDNPVARGSPAFARGRCCCSSTRSVGCCRRPRASCSSASTTPPTSASPRRSCSRRSPLW